MGLIVYWTQIAEDKLDDIFYYYKLKAIIKVAQNLVNRIVDTTINLNKNPKIRFLLQYFFLYYPFFYII